MTDDKRPDHPSSPDTTSGDTPADASTPSAPDSPAGPASPAEQPTRQHATGGHATPAPGDDAPATEQIPQTGPHATEQIQRPVTEPAARAYSQVPPSQAPGTAQFPTGTQPADDFGPVGPSSGPQDATTGPVRTAPTKRKRSRLTIAVASVLAVVLVLIIAGVGSELYLRHRLTSCVSDSVSDSAGFPVDVSLSKKPILLQWISGSAPWAELHGNGDNGEHIDVRVEDVGLSGGEVGSVDGTVNINGVALDGRADNVKGDGSEAVTLGKLDATGSVDFNRVVAASKAAADTNGGTEGQPTGMAGGIESITGNAADQTIQVVSNFPALFMTIPVTTIIKPVLNQGKVTFEAVKTTAEVPLLSSIEIPQNWAQQIIDQVTPQMFGSFFNEVNITTLKVTGNGVDFAVNGTDVRLDQQTTSMSGQGKSFDCSII